MIIIGYPGVGKSTLAAKYDSADYEASKGIFPKSIIDLDSSIFNICDDEMMFDPMNHRKHDNWVELYCKVAEELSDQDHLVFVSSHAAVQKYLRECGVEVGVIYPSLELKQQWLEKLRRRYMYEGRNPSDNSKNFAAYNRACDHYEEDIEALKSNGFELIEIESMAYDLEKLIFGEELIPDGTVTTVFFDNEEVKI